MKSRMPLPRDPVAMDVFSWLHEDQQSATVINSSLVDNPTIRLLSFHLSQRQ